MAIGGRPVRAAHDNTFHYAGRELDALAEARNYYAWVLRQFEPHMGRDVIEVGAGIGTFSEFILSVPRVERLVVIEPGANTLPHLRERLASNPRVEVRPGYLSDNLGELEGDTFVAVNVMEHVPDDDQFLGDAIGAVRPGGHLLLFVPALPAIFGSLDVAFEHHRRYTRTSLRRVIERAGWKPVRISYMNLPGVAAWFVAGRLLRKTTISSSDARAYDRLVVPWLSRIEDLIQPPFGASLVAIARKP